MNKVIYFLTAVLMGGMLVSTPVAVFAQTVPDAPNSTVTPTSSLNWAGYVTTGGSYTSVSGSWTVPTISSPTAGQSDATWVGIGGVSSGDLIQAGTQATIPASGQVSYQAWFEMLPGVMQPVSMTVNPGDAISASLIESSPNEWSITIHDNTNNQNFQTTVSYNSSLSSAEWIEEMPSSERGFVPIDNFGTLSFSNATTVNNGTTEAIAQTNGQAMTMITRENQPLATVSALNADGASFTVTRTSVAPDSASSGGRSPYTRRPWSRIGVGPQGFQGFRFFSHGRGGSGFGMMNRSSRFGGLRFFSTRYR